MYRTLSLTRHTHTLPLSHDHVRKENTLVETPFFLEGVLFANMVVWERESVCVSYEWESTMYLHLYTCISKHPFFLEGVLFSNLVVWERESVRVSCVRESTI